MRVTLFYPIDSKMDIKETSEGPPITTGMEAMANDLMSCTQTCSSFSKDILIIILRNNAGDDQNNFINKLLQPRPAVVGQKPYIDILRITEYTINADSDLRLFMLNGLQDFTLLKMAKEFGFPRGFPVIVNVRTGSLTMSGFYPKFANDDEKERSFLEEAKQAKKLTVVRKWSGHLTSAVLYKVNDRGDVRFLVTSKKSADPNSTFVQGGRELWSKILTPVILNTLWASNIRSLWAETMTKNDQKHGAQVRQPTIVITAAGEAITHDTVRPRVIGDDELFNLLSTVGIQDFCAVPIHPPSECIEDFVLAVQKDRDYMTERQFQALLTSLHLPACSRHMSILGDRLEGLILKFYFADDSSKILKYKFPGYTKVTMCVRECSLSHRKDGNPLDLLGEKGPEGAWRPTFKFVRCVETFVNRWVFDENNRPYYRGMMMMYGELYDKYVHTYNHADVTAVGPWILAADEVDYLVQTGTTIKPVTFFQLKSLSQAYTVYLALGPIGIGKTTASNTLSRCLGLHHIDGDILGFDEDTVLSLGSERNPFTLSCVAMVLAEGKTPILSTGGGVLLGSGMRFNGIDTIESMINGPINVIPIVPGPGELWNLGTPHQFLETLYQDKQFVLDAVEGRIRRATAAGGTPMKPGEVKNFGAKMSGLSIKNYPIVVKILEKTLSDHSEDPSVTFPVVYEGKLADPTPQILAKLGQFKSPGPVRSLRCTQLRSLYLVHARDIVLDSEIVQIFGKNNLQKLTQRLGQQRVYHETKLYSKQPVQFELDRKVEESDELVKLWQITMLDLKEQTLSWSCILMDDTSDRHLTVDAGNHKDFMMRDVAREYNSKSKEIILQAWVTDKSKVTTTFDVTYPLQEQTERFLLVKTQVSAKYLAPSVIFDK